MIVKLYAVNWSGDILIRNAYIYVQAIHQFRCFVQVIYHALFLGLFAFILFYNLLFPVE